MIIIKSIFVVMAMVVNKALLPLFTTRNLSTTQVLAKAKTVTTNIQSHVLTFGVMDPPTATMLTDIASAQADEIQIQNLRQQIVTLEGQRDEKTQKIVSDITYKYCPSVKDTANGVKSVVDLSGMTCKGFGPAKTMVRFNNSYPEPYKLDQSIGMRIIQSLYPSDVLSKGKPYGAKSIICYRQVGGVPPLRNNHPLATMLPPFSKMKLEDTDFVTANVGQTVYYILCWVDKDGNKGPESPVFPYTITS